MHPIESLFGLSCGRDLLGCGTQISGDGHLFIAVLVICFLKEVLAKDVGEQSLLPDFDYFVVYPRLDQRFVLRDVSKLVRVWLVEPDHLPIVVKSDVHVCDVHFAASFLNPLVLLVILKHDVSG